MEEKGKIKLIVCHDAHNAIGYKGQLLDCIPEDLAHFHKTTSHHILVVGKTTYHSLPKPLKHRRLFVISSKEGNSIGILKEDKSLWFDTLDSAIQHYQDNLYQSSGVHLFLSGGERIYKEGLPYAEELYISVIKKVYPNSDTFFPRGSLPNYNLKQITPLSKDVDLLYYIKK